MNTIKLVRFYDGVDGLKTGFTSSAKYCVTTTAKKSNMRLLSVVMGAETSDLRSKDTTNLLNYGFNSYKLDLIMSKTKILGNVKVEKGKKDNVDLVLKEDATSLKKINDKSTDYFVNLKVDKIKAPVKTGDKVGTAEILDNDGKFVMESDVTVTKNIDKANYFDYLKKNLKILTTGF